MPDWETIDFCRKSLKRKETYNEFGRKVRFEPLKLIPRVKRSGKPCESYEKCYETLLWKENDSTVDETNDFIKLALDKGFNEEQALHILHYNNFDQNLSECDLEIYKPSEGMHVLPNRQTINKIIEKIKCRISNHQSRDLNLILMEFPTHTMGELLDFYGNNRMTIKRKTLKLKSKTKGISRENLNKYLSQMNPSLCGSSLYQKLSTKMCHKSSSNIELSEILDLSPEMLDRYLLKYSKPNQYLLEQTGAGIVDAFKTSADECEYTDEDITTKLQSLEERLSDIEQWMKPLQDPPSRICHKWGSLDIALLLVGLEKFGTDFEMLSDAISTKTSAMVKSFYLMFRNRYQLDRLVLQSGPNGG